MSLKGRTFRFNGNITRYPDSGKGFLVVREVDNVKEYFFTDSDGNKYKEFEEAEKLYYVGEYPPASSDATITVWQNDTWLNDKYKTITFIEEPTGFTQNGMPYTRTEEEFEQFLLYNCTEVISEIETITDFDGKVHHLRDETVPSLMAAKADKVSSATNGNFAGLDANGNLTDSGHKHSDYLTQHQDISGKVNGPSSAVNNRVAVFDGTTGKAITDSGFTIGKSVPSDAVFTDTNTWRPIEGTTASPSADAAFSSIAGNALNNNLSKVNHSTNITASTLADLKTNLLAAVNGVNSSDFLAIRIAPSFSSDGFTSGSTYGGYAYNIYKASGTTSYFSVILSNNIGEDMFIGYNNGTWKFNSLNNKFTTIVTSGSMRNLAGQNGLFWLTSSVTDKPTTSGGLLILRSYDANYCVGEYIDVDSRNIYSISYQNNTWENKRFNFYTGIKSITKVDGTYTTGATGNVALGTSASTGKIIATGAICTSMDAYCRLWYATTNAGWYATLVNPNTGAAIANTQVTITYWVIETD